MNFDLSDEQKLLAEQARGLLGQGSLHDRLRSLIDRGLEWDEPLWRELGSLGFLSAAIPDAYGGLGLTDLDLGAISEQLGHANAALPFFSSIVLAANAILLAGNEEQKQRWLPSIASGELVATFAYAEGPNGWPAQTPACQFDGAMLTGTKWPVADAGVSAIAVVLARHDDVPALVVVELDGAGVSRTRLDSFDQLRAHYRVSFVNVAAELLAGAPAEEVLDLLLDRAAVQAAFEAVGAAEACLFMARDHALERRIFGRPLAGYQAIKHKLADLLVLVELARSSAYYAGWAASEGSPELPRAAAAARLNALAAYETAARENMQVHGGIAYTFEANCHFYYRRERTLALSLGNRERWADRLIATFTAEMGGEAA